MIDWILKLIGCYCDPELALAVPTVKKQNREGVTIPDNISFDANGKSFKNDHTEDGMVSEEVTLGRTASRTAGDDWILSQDPPKNKPTLNPNKYFRLKTFWAKQLSAKATADALKSERGYKIRTVEYYWRAFNKSLQYDNAATPSTAN